MIDYINDASVAILSWLITYLFHSSILVGSALVFARFGPENLGRVKDLALKFAVVGSLLTATIQTIAPSGPLTLDFAVPGNSVIKPIEIATTNNSMLLPEERLAKDVGLISSDKRPVEANSGNPKQIVGLQWPAFVVIIWVAFGILFALRYSLRWIRFLGMIGNCESVGSGSLQAMIDEISSSSEMRRKVNLTSSTYLSSPVAFGRREICIPRDFTDHLTREEQFCALAHEVAHLRRNDPLWLILFGVIKNLMFVQPLNRIACTRFTTESEFLCDESVMRLTDDPASLAQSLYKYLPGTGSPAMKQLASTMAGWKGTVLERTEKMVNWNGVKSVGSRSIAIVIVICGALLLAGWAAPKAFVHATLFETSSPEIPAKQGTSAVPQKEKTVSGTIVWVGGTEYPIEMTVSTAELQNQEEKMVVLDGLIKNDKKLNFHILVEIRKRQTRDIAANVDVNGEGSDECENPEVGSGLKKVVQSMIELCDVKTFPELSDIKSSLNEGKYLVSVQLSVIVNDVYKTTL